MKEAANCGGLANLVSVYSFDPLVRSALRDQMRNVAYLPP